MMRNIKLILEYDGKRYLGWQRLGDSDKTIQGKIENVLHQMTGEKIEIIGSGRTDAGAHARGQVANFKTATTMPTEDILAYLNQYLPQDIVVKSVEEVPERFHARYLATGKKYSYYIWNNPVPNAFERNVSYHVPQKLSIERMEAAASLLIGEHDFLGFSSLKKSKKSTVRTIQAINIEKNGAIVSFTFVGDGFLYNMIRIMMGTLMEIGTGERAVESIEQVFASKNRQDAGITVPAQGLFLDEVYYERKRGMEDGK